MSRVSLIEQLYAPKKKSALEFNYDGLWAPPIRFLLSQQDIDGLYKIATSLKYNDNIEKKYELIDAIMRPRGFKRGNCGTNRVVYNFLEDTSFCMKIALDRVGIQDSPREYKNQEFFKPFCCKIFEVDPTGVIACVERVNPISSLEEFMSIADDVFNMMVTKIIGKYVVDDLGTEKFLNYGIRYNSNGVAFGPVILDYPYAYELDGAKLRCSKPIQIGDKEFACGGEIDYDAGLNNLVCTKCGRTYSARELAKDDSKVIKFYTDEEQGKMRARIIRNSDGAIIKDSGRSSTLYLTKEEYEEGIRMFQVKNLDPRPVEKTVRNKYVPMKKLREQYYTDLQLKAYEEMQKRNEEPFNTVIKSGFEPRIATRGRSVIGKNKETVETLNTFEEDRDIYKDDAVMEESEDNESEVIEVTEDLDSEVVEESEDNESEVVEESEDEEDSEDEDDDSEDEDDDDSEDDDSEDEDDSEDQVNMIEQIMVAISNLLPELDIDKEEIEEILERNHYNFDTIMVELRELNNKRLIEKSQKWFNDDSDNDPLKASMKKHLEFIELTEDEESEVDEETEVNSEEVDEGKETEQSNDEEFNHEMESEVFPEINNSEIIVGVNMDEEPDYSNYIPPEEDDASDDDLEDEDDDYSHLYPTDRKEEKRDAKQAKSQKSNIGDMSDY